MKNSWRSSDVRYIAVLRIAAVTSMVFVFALVASAQSSSNSPIVRIPSADDKNDSGSPSIDDMVVKQKISRQKKEYDEMLKRGDEALKLSEELELSFENKDSFSTDDIQKLQALEKVVSKIRDDLGGDDEDGEMASSITAHSSETSAKNDPLFAVKFLRNSTVKLVEELKKSTRFSISVAAIETSNAVIRLARFLRLKK